MRYCLETSYTDPHGKTADTYFFSPNYLPLENYGSLKNG